MTSRTEYDRISADFEPYELSIDGRDLAYRDPNNPDMRQKLMDQSDEEYEANPHAYNMMNPLYDYSYGELRKAGEALNISNVNDKEEVEQMLEYLSKPQTFAEAAMEEEVEEAVTPSLAEELAEKGAPLSEGLQKDIDFMNDQVSMLRDGTYNDSYRRMASGFGPAGGSGTFASDALKEQMNTGTGEIDVNEFAKQRNIRSNSLANDFARSMGKNIFDNNTFKNSIFS
tara:strand:+ start:13 stop:696 length:684 start_codon:yes stop_codon:yes gene_type:complete